MSYLIRHLDTANFQINRRPVEETAASKRKVAFFFLLHYGIFHTVYLAFVVFDSRAGVLGSAASYLLCALVFAVNRRCTSPSSPALTFPAAPARSSSLVPSRSSPRSSCTSSSTTC